MIGMNTSSKLLLALPLAIAMANPGKVEEAAVSQPASDAAQITILYDAFGHQGDARQAWGYAALVEVGGKRILFDTGGDAEIFAHNVESLGIDLSGLDFVVVSHRHSDHYGGLSYVLEKSPSVKVYTPFDLGGVFGTTLPSAFYRKQESLPAEHRYYDGAPKELLHLSPAWSGANIEIITETTEIVPGIHLISLTSSTPGTRELNEVSMAVETDEGLVLLVGCSHPGIENIVEEAAAIGPAIHFLAGGLHLLALPDDEIDRIATTLKDDYRVGYVAIGHCTGEPAFEAFGRIFDARYMYAGLGRKVVIPIS